ncbi:hypothetical protein NDU88_009896 [Pleurodeles waltl]|uniref:Nuclease HARBI1 n=1 Tax=Pleurodeles waltl TaxID=8319 RepID=A0AAV7QUU0_PLEWA|nr:hypothetical protein NDU88_009896 [Pleurodeles waltl]
MAVTSGAVRTITAGVHRHWLLKPIVPNVNQCRIAPQSLTAHRDGVQRQGSYLISPCPALQVRQPPFQGATWHGNKLRHTYLGWEHRQIPAHSVLLTFLQITHCDTLVLDDSLLAVLLHRARLLGQVRRWWHPPVYRPLVDLSTMEESHIIITYKLDRATIQELCAQLEPDLMSAIRRPTGIPPLVQVLSVLHFLGSGSFQTTVAMASGMSQPMFSNVLSRVLSALLKHMRSYIVFPQVEDLPTVNGDFYALEHIPNIIGAIDGTHVAFVPSAGKNRCTETGRATIR